ncbi:MAG TPA: glycosyltransferase family 39 protein [Thermomicrobiales bacterium]|nr:glycosyltransferase family 39 protein [Thermomicrobiales bacterium]
MKFDRRDLIIAFVIFLAALWVNANAVPTTIPHRDEGRWIGRAGFLGELLDPLGDFWQSGEVMWGQPPLGSYLMGVGLLAQGQDLHTNDLPDFHYSDAWNARHGAAPGEKDLAAARRTDSVVGALLAVCVYLIARSLGNRVAGVAAALILIPHPLSVYLSSLADSDAILTLLLALATLAAMALAERPTWPCAILLGVLLGLGGSAKLSPLALAIPLAALGAWCVLRGWRDRDAVDVRRLALGWRLLTVPALTLTTFVVSYPYLWPSPIGRIRDLFAFREQEMTNQGRIWPYLKVDGPGDAIARIGNWLATVDSTTGSGAAWIAERLGHDWHPVGVDLLLALIGAEVLIFLVFRHGLASRWGLAAAILFGQVGLIVVGMRADFERYLLPVVVTVAVCGGLAVGQAWSFARAAVVRRAVRRPAAEPVAVEAPGQIAPV